MAYSSSGLKLFLGGLSGGMNIWLLDCVDAIADINTSNYISDGVTRGMLQGDLVIARTRTSTLTGAITAVNLCWVIDVGTGTGALGVDLTNGLEVTATDSD